jgi:hypothetical protein
VKSTAEADMMLVRARAAARGLFIGSDGFYQSAG